MKAYCITLPETEERNAKAFAHFRSIGLKVKPFTGVHAGDFGLSTRFTYEPDAPGSGWNIGAARTGCWLSHYSLWAAFEIMDGEHFVVLENDAQFPDDWKNRFYAALGNVPKDYDLLYIGSCCCSDKPAKLIKGEVFEVKYPFCTHAYVVAKKALGTLLKMRKVWAPIDIQMTTEAFPSLKVYTVLPTIVTQFDTVLKP